MIIIYQSKPRSESQIQEGHGGLFLSISWVIRTKSQLLILTSSKHLPEAFDSLSLKFSGQNSWPSWSEAFDFSLNQSTHLFTHIKTFNSIRYCARHWLTKMTTCRSSCLQRAPTGASTPTQKLSFTLARDLPSAEPVSPARTPTLLSLPECLFLERSEAAALQYQEHRAWSWKPCFCNLELRGAGEIILLSSPQRWCRIEREHRCEAVGKM